MVDDPQLAWRLGRVEDQVSKLADDTISQQWLEQRFGRLEDAIAAGREAERAERRALERDVAELKTLDRSRRNATFVAVLGAAGALIVSLLQQVPL